MKKIIAVLAAAALAVSFAGCAKQQAASEAGSAAGSDDSWTKVKESGTLVLGLDKSFPPMGFVDTETGGITGFDVELAEAACEKLGIKLKTQPIDWGNKTAELNNGNVDCLWNGFSITEEREKTFTMSEPYMKNNQIILIKSGSGYKGLDSLAGKVIGVQTDSSAETALNSSKMAEFKKSLKNVVKIDDYSKAVMEMQNGTIDAIAIDEVVARYYLTKNPGAYEVLSDGKGDVSLAAEKYAVAFRKQDKALRDKINTALEEMAKDGSAAKISQKWFDKNVITVGK